MKPSAAFLVILASAILCVSCSRQGRLPPHDYSYACLNNLRLYDTSKKQWADENGKKLTNEVTMDDLRPYLGKGPNGDLPTCPSGGKISLGRIGDKTLCSIHGAVP